MIGGADVIGGMIALFIIVVSRDLDFGWSERRIIVQNLSDFKLKTVKKCGRYRKYVFKAPFSRIVDTSKVERLLEDFLGRHVECTFDRFLVLKVYQEKLPKRIRRGNDE